MKISPPQIDLQIQYNPYQNSSWSFGRNWQAEPRIQIQGTQNSQNNIEWEKKKGIKLDDSTFLISNLL